MAEAVLDDGGPAFPFTEKSHDGSHYHSHPGMSRRDWLAAQAMPVLIASAFQKNDQTRDGWLISFEEIAIKSFAAADAMIAVGARAHSDA